MAKTDLEKANEVYRDWMCGAGTGVVVPNVLRCLNQLAIVHGGAFTLAGACQAMDDLARTAQNVKKSLEQAAQSEPDDEGRMYCDHPGCNREPTHDKSTWIRKGHMRVTYWCAEHAPEGVELIDGPDLTQGDQP